MRLVANRITIPPLPQSGATPLYMACQMGHSDVVEILIRNGANINLPRDVCMGLLYITLLIKYNSCPILLLYYSEAKKN